MARELTLNEEGQLVDGDGNVFTVDDEPLQVKGALSQKQADQAIQQRLARQKETIKQLEEQANQTPELQKTLEALKAEKAELEEQAQSAQQRAQEEAANQIQAANTRAQELEAELKQERTGRVQDQVKNQILSSAGDRWINPAQDLVPKLLQTHQREPKTGPDGQPVPNEYVDLFRVSYPKGEDGEEVTEALPLDKALEAVASRPDFKHYMRPSQQGGSGGGGGYGQPQKKRSQMNTDEKAAYVSKHGKDAYLALPE